MSDEPSRLPLEFQGLKILLDFFRKKIADLLLKKIPLLRSGIPRRIEQKLGFISSLIKDRKLGGRGWWGSSNFRHMHPTDGDCQAEGCIVENKFERRERKGRKGGGGCDECSHTDLHPLVQ